jgi:aconitate hydratase
LADDRIDIVDLASLQPERPVRLVIHHTAGGTDEIEATHTMSEEHIEWFHAGSALNVLRRQEAEDRA